jgi:hypothetical protein
MLRHWRGLQIQLNLPRLGGASSRALQCTKCSVHLLSSIVHILMYEDHAALNMCIEEEEEEKEEVGPAGDLEYAV